MAKLHMAANTRSGKVWREFEHATHNDTCMQVRNKEGKVNDLYQADTFHRMVTLRRSASLYGIMFGKSNIIPSVHFLLLLTIANTSHNIPS